MKKTAAIATALLLATNLTAQAQAPAAIPAPIPAAIPPAVAAPTTPAAPTESSAEAPVLPEQLEKTFYKYANYDAEYVISLPEAPTVKTIWEEDISEETPYEGASSENSAIGEIATYTRVDPITGQKFDVQIHFLKADPDFIATINEEALKKAFDEEYLTTPLENKKFTFTVDPVTTLKRAFITGFSTDSKGNHFFNAKYYLTGRQSVQEIKILFSVESKTYGDYYKAISKSITYRPL